MKFIETTFDKLEINDEFIKANHKDDIVMHYIKTGKKLCKFKVIAGRPDMEFYVPVDDTVWMVEKTKKIKRKSELLEDLS